MPTRRHQLSLGLETKPTSPTEAPPDEAILQALAELLLEAYGEETSRAPSDPVKGADDER